MNTIKLRGDLFDDKPKVKPEEGEQDEDSDESEESEPEEAKTEAQEEAPKSKCFRANSMSNPTHTTEKEAPQ